MDERPLVALIISAAKAWLSGDEPMARSMCETYFGMAQADPSAASYVQDMLKWAIGRIDGEYRVPVQLWHEGRMTVGRFTTYMGAN